MAEVLELVYIVVVDGEEKKEREGIASFGYTPPVLQSTLQLMGCKARHAFKMTQISRRVFNVLQSESSLDTWPPPKIEVSGLDTSLSDYDKGNSSSKYKCLVEVEVGDKSVLQKDDIYNAEPYDLCKRRTTVVNRETFLDIVCDVLAEYKYVGPTQRDDLVFACRIRERKESVTVLLCGTSGCGKSTLSSLLGSRLGITTVISTDSIRHMMRSFADEKQNPLLWASTYHAGECLDPIAVSEAMARRKAKKLTHIFHSVPMDDVSGVTGAGKACAHMLNVDLSNNELISARQMAIEGFKAQSEMVIDNLDRLITAWEKRKESVVVEGVHLSLNFVMELMKRHPSIIPFMIYIANESKHLERFAVRAKYMALDPTKNKYVRYFHNIRTIQEYLCNWADKHLVPKINNTNVDRSVAAIHATVFSCLRRREMGEHFYDPITNTVPLIDEEHRNQVAANSLSSKGMFQLIQRRGSSRNLMALINTDGSVAKAWPVNTGCCNRRSIMCQGNAKGVINPMYGPLKISKAESVNLQFGHFGMSAWPSVIGASSHATTVDESCTDGTESESRNFSSCCSSPRISDGPAKEVREEFVASGSDEEAEILPTVHSDGDLSDVEGKYIHEEIEGSVEEESIKSDEEYDLVTEKLLENGYWSDDDKSKNVQVPARGQPTVKVKNCRDDKYQQI